MTFRHFGAASLLLATVLMSGCDTLPIPFMDKPQPPEQEAHSQAKQEPVKAKPLSRSEKIAKGLSEELDWFPSFEQPLAQLETRYAAESSPSGRNQTLSSIAYLYDAKLFVLFQDMLDFLHKDARVAELKEQNSWLSKRQALLTQAFLREQDEAAARIAASQAFIDATRERIKEIEAKRKLVVLR